MELINNKIEQEQEIKLKDRTTGEGQQSAKIVDENKISDEEKLFYSSRENINKTFISKNRIY